VEAAGPCVESGVALPVEVLGAVGHPVAAWVPGEIPATTAWCGPVVGWTAW